MASSAPNATTYFILTAHAVLALRKWRLVRYVMASLDLIETYIIPRLNTFTIAALRHNPICTFHRIRTGSKAKSQSKKILVPANVRSTVLCVLILTQFPVFESVPDFQYKEMGWQARRLKRKTTRPQTEKNVMLDMTIYRILARARDIRTRSNPTLSFNATLLTMYRVEIVTMFWSLSVTFIQGLQFFCGALLWSFSPVAGNSAWLDRHRFHHSKSQKSRHR